VKQPDSYEVDFLLYGWICLNLDFGVETRFLDENGRFFFILALISISHGVVFSGVGLF
jgi:hypothetical protein